MLALTCACATFSNMAGAAGDAPVIKQNVRLLSQPPVSYPEAAKAAGHQGVVKLRLSPTPRTSLWRSRWSHPLNTARIRSWIWGENIKSGMNAWF